MGDSVTPIQKQFVIVNDQAPLGPFKGQLWRDTSNNVLKQWDGSTWVSVQTAPDDSSVRLNGSGQLEVIKPRTEPLPSFSNISLAPNTDQTQSESANIDVSEYDNAIITFVAEAVSGHATSWLIQVDGETQFQDSSNDALIDGRLVVDVSNKTGTVQFYCECSEDGGELSPGSYLDIEFTKGKVENEVNI